MAHYLISYDLRNSRDYQPLYDLLKEWNATSILESLWIADLNGKAPAVGDAIKAVVDSDDGICIVEVTSNADWACYRVNPDGGEAIQKASP